MKFLILDNYDSFTHNLCHYVQQFTDHVDVIRNDNITLYEASQYDKIILSPGPGLPGEHQNLKYPYHEQSNSVLSRMISEIVKENKKRDKQ